MVELVQWQTAAPIWPAALQTQDNMKFRQPAILRFTGDDFMTELQTKLADQPEALVDSLVRPETWRETAAEIQAKNPLAPFSDPLKLYQPAHGRFYLVTANLICRLPGLPDRTVDSAAQEQVFFVLRKLAPNADGQPVQPYDESTFDEYAWTGDHWETPADPNRLHPAEERLPMFFTNYDEGSRTRRLLAGFIPVSKRETYQAAPQLGEALPADGLADSRPQRYEAAVSGAMATLQQEIAAGASGLDAAKAREVLIFALLDLADFLAEYLTNFPPATWTPAGSAGWNAADSLEEAVFVWLRDHTLLDAASWLAALKDVFDQKTAILAGEINDQNSPLTFAIGQPTLNDIETALAPAQVQGLHDAVEAYLDASPAAPPPPELLDLARVDPQAGPFYRIRCVYERQRCQTSNLKPRLKAELGVQNIIEQLVSLPSAPFQLASFFDPDAPARRLRIPTPIDTSIDGLRKFPKNVSFALSNELRRQIERMQNLSLEDLDNGDVGPEGPGLEFGMICSLSIPIITICALILLMIIVQLLNIVFWWLPFFKICLPIPVKAKG